MVEIIWSDFARENLIDIYDFIAKDSSHYAEKELLKIANRVNVLNTFRLSGKIVSEYNNDSVRELIEGNYRIIYKIYSEKSVKILTVHHSSKLLR
jgi:toxin ParE1/3/4